MFRTGTSNSEDELKFFDADVAIWSNYVKQFYTFSLNSYILYLNRVKSTNLVLQQKTEE